QRVVHQLDLRGGDDVAVAVQDPLHAVTLGELLGAASVACSDRHQPIARRPGGGDDGKVGNPGGAEDADAQGLHLSSREAELTDLSRSARELVGELGEVLAAEGAE